MSRRLFLAAFALVFAVLTGTICQEPPYGAPGIARATPTLSGATLVDISNPDFSGTGLGEVGTSPTNSDFETDGGDVGTPASNYDFETSDLSNWTATGSPTVSWSDRKAEFGARRKMHMTTPLTSRRRIR